MYYSSQYMIFQIYVTNQMKTDVNFIPFMMPTFVQYLSYHQY